jgi:hypothetical protein
MYMAAKVGLFVLTMLVTAAVFLTLTYIGTTIGATLV